MRIMVLPFSVITLWTASACAQSSVGDTVVIVRDCEIKTANGAADKAYRGMCLKVTAIKGDSLRVSNGILGWIDSNDTISLDEAIPHFTAQIKSGPTAAIYEARGMVWHGKKQYDKAISDCSTAIRLSPATAGYYGSRGLCLLAKKRWDGAIADFDEAIRREPTCSVYTNRGSAWAGKRDYVQAIADFDEAMRLEPRYVFAYRSAAWLRATCPDARFRDGKRAVQDATLACKLEDWKDGSSLDTLAAAHAEAGDFKEAVTWEETALQIASAADKVEWRSRLALYKAGKPYRNNSQD